MSVMPENYEPFQGVWPTVAETAFVHRRAVIIGRVRLGDHVSVWPCAVLRGDDAEIVIGDRSNIQDGVVVHTTSNRSWTNVGAEVTVGHNAVLHGCQIADHCLIGMGAIVMDNAELGEWTLVGAGALVTADQRIPAGSLVLGSPARVVRQLNTQERDWIEYSWDHYRQRAEQHRVARPGE